jgi:hypothetical protein
LEVEKNPSGRTPSRPAATKRATGASRKGGRDTSGSHVIGA